MAKPTDERLPSEFLHVNLTMNNGTFTNPFPTPTPLKEGVWITLDNRDFRIAFAPGIIGTIPNGGLRLWRSDKRGTYFFPCADAGLLVVTPQGNNGRIAIMAG